MKHFTILEINDTHEIMMVGTIQNISEKTKECFLEELQKLLESHFDADIEIKDKSIDLFDGNGEWLIDAYTFTYDEDKEKDYTIYPITIMETWFNKNF